MSFAPMLHVTILAVAVATCGALAGQGALPNLPDDMPLALSPSLGQVIEGAPGVVRADGKVLGVGPGYRAWFASDGVTLSGPGAPPAMVLRLDAVGRRQGDNTTEWSVPPAAAPEIVDGVVCYQRGQVLERYETRRDGIEQSFVFAALPAGTGDLVVRVAVDTDLVATAGSEVSQQVCYTGPDGGVSISGILGIDARGAQCPGVLRVTADAIEFVLLESFVERATLPLVLDPLVGSLFSTGGSGVGPGAQVAYDSTNDVYLVAWTEAAPFGGQTTLGRLVTSQGTLKGGLLCLECETTTGTWLNSVVNVNVRDMFVVWMQGYFPVTVSASTGAVVVARNLPTINVYSVLGGESTLLDDDVVHVWMDQQNPKNVIADEVEVAPSGSLRITKSVVVGSGGLSPLFLSISKSGGASGRHLIAWEVGQQFVSLPIHGAVVDRDLNVLNQLVILPTPTSSGSTVVGDGDQWLIGYGSGGISGILVSWDTTMGGAWAAASIAIVPSPNGGNIGWMGGSVLIVHRPAFGPDVIGTIDPYTCQPCEASAQLIGSYAIASQLSGDPNAGPWALIANQLGQVRFYRADDGITTDFGGGCGSGGRAAATCARVGNAGFTVRLRDGRHGAPAFLVLGTQSLSFACGTCTLMVNPLTVVGAGLTDVHGNAEVLLPIANNPGWIGQAFLEQWVTVGGTACSLGVEMSNALRVQLQ